MNATVQTEQTPYLSVEAAAKFTGVPVPTLNTLRTRGNGPLFLKRGTRVFYKRDHLVAWMEKDVRLSTSDAGESR